MAHFYLNSYSPLVATRAGRTAAERYDLLPFIDGSIRREPDLEHRFPSISCLCRAGKFAPRLRTDDVVAYMTKKERYGAQQSQQRLTAVLKVQQVFPNHQTAAAWYQSQGLPLPSNCWVISNPAVPLDQSHRRFAAADHSDENAMHRQWDALYRWRAKHYPVFVVCRRLYGDLSWSAPDIGESALRRAFGTVPGTHNPRKETLETFKKLMELLKLDVAY